MSEPAPTPPLNNDFLYGVFESNQRWRDRLARRASHKALNMTDEEMQISVRNGITWRELLALATIASALIGGGLVGLKQLLPTTPPPVQQVQGSDTDTDTLYDFSISSGPQQ